MAQIEYIKDLYENEEVSLREISRRTGHNYSSVKKYVHKKKFVMKNQNTGYLPLEHIPGNGQVDFGTFHYYTGNGTMENL